ncbi:MAG: 3'-5' exonuclease [Prevotellaceae bacterium]|jgi:DNA polymerase-3 subunit epsilon|nr:3'-5' exonuclease [Prevotellaceae bacterium]
MLRDFAAIDFETANYHRSSVCSVGVVIVRDGVIAEKIYRLIRPDPDWYSYTVVHGISFEDTENEKRFPSVWEEILPKFAGLPLVAHNAPFDRSCLQEAHNAYRMEYPNYEFRCTLRASRRIFGKSLPNHKLTTVAAYCGYDLKNHHYALADAEACAIIAMKIPV